MGCTGGKAERMAIRMTPEMREPQSNDPERPVIEFPYNGNRLKDIDFKAIIDLNEPWTDPYFRPELTSILDATMMRPDRLKSWETFTWKRPKDVYGKNNYTLFTTISPNDIKQGYCGDCYFLSSIASLAENPDRVAAIFNLTPLVNKAGCYAMKLYVNGEPKVVVVDDYFPYCTHKDDWAFSRSSSEKEIWVLLLEKAWAKIYGSYQRIEAGTTGEALPALCGAPSEFVFHAESKDREALWKKIRESDLKNFIIATAVSSNRQGKTSDEMKNVGLVDAHAYSLISTHDVKDEKGKQVRLIKIRNPWGFKEWTGDWSDKSDKWTPELKAQLSLEDKEDGVFFISFEDYANFFYITTFCKYIKDSDLSIMADQHSPSKYCVQKFTIPKSYDTPIVFVLNQIHARFVDETMRGSYRYAPMKLILAKIVQSKTANPNEKGQDELAFVEGDYMCFQHAHLELPKLTEGEYVIFFKAEWEILNPVRKLVMNIYAPDPIEITRVNSNKFPIAIFMMMNDWLNKRLQLGTSYEIPVMSHMQDEYDEEEYQKIKSLSLRFWTAKQGEKIFFNYATKNSLKPDDQPQSEMAEQVLDLMPRATVVKNFSLNNRFKSLYIDIIRQPIGSMFQSKVKTTILYNSNSYSKDIKAQQSSEQTQTSYSGLYLIFKSIEKSDKENEISIEVKGTNDSNIFCIENTNCPPLTINLEVSCSTLKQNISLKNIYVGRGDKKCRTLEGSIGQEQNSCLKLSIEPFTPIQYNESVPHQAEEELKDDRTVEKETSQLIGQEANNIEVGEQDKQQKIDEKLPFQSEIQKEKVIANNHEGEIKQE